MRTRLRLKLLLLAALLPTALASSPARAFDTGFQLVAGGPATLKSFVQSGDGNVKDYPPTTFDVSFDLTAGTIQITNFSVPSPVDNINLTMSFFNVPSVINGTLTPVGGGRYRVDFPNTTIQFNRDNFIGTLAFNLNSNGATVPAGCAGRASNQFLPGSHLDLETKHLELVAAICPYTGLFGGNPAFPFEFDNAWRLFVRGDLLAVPTPCGDGDLDAGEQCDDGNNLDGDCCSATCSYESSGSSCDDGNACTVSDTCNGAGTCSGPPLACNDGLFCNGTESCDPATGCEAGTPPFLDDGIGCTIDSCDEGLDTVVHAPNDALCDNGLFCDGAELCSVVNDCQAGTPPVVDDGVSCTLDACDEGGDVVLHLPSDAACDNGLFCDGSETCDVINDCQDGTPPVTDDGVGCTNDSCDEDGDVVVHVPDDALCDNGLFCDGSETCDVLNDCQAGAPPVSDDGVGCTSDSCDEDADLVVHTADDAACDNGLFCDGSETCDILNDCQAGTPLVIDDGVGCTHDSCDEAGDIVVNAPDDALCDNGLFCDGSETCDVINDCQDGAPPVTDDGVGCTVDSCDEAGDVLVHTPDDALCDNGLFCDGIETCDAIGDCQAGAAPATDDGVGCTIDSCDEATDLIVHAPNHAACGDGNVCTDDTCDPVLDCQTTPNVSPCDDGDACSEGDVCAGGVCQSGPVDVCQPAACEDGLDNDGDGLVDDADPGCAAPSDESELSGLACDNGIDDDGDGATDLGDPGCDDGLDASELSSALPCDDGVDNDGDGDIDFPDDAGCLDLSDENEIELQPGDVVVSDSIEDLLVHVDRVEGTENDVFGGGMFVSPAGVEIDVTGDILVADVHAPGVIRVDPMSGSQEGVSMGGLLAFPNDLAIDPMGDVFVVDQMGRVVHVDVESGEQQLISSGGSFAIPFGIAIESSGDLVVTDLLAQAVIRIDPATGAQQIVSSGGLLSFPNGLAVERDGGIVVVSTFGSQGAVVRIDPVTGAQELVSFGGVFVSPRGIAVESDGDLVVADPLSPFGGVIRVHPASGSQTVISSTVGFGIAVVPSACFDGFDNDGDGLTDFPEDPGCASATALTESPDCQDGIDNDKDGFRDHPEDVGCRFAWSERENPACNDGFDNDQDGYMDYPLDSQCIAAWDTKEVPTTACGFGFELALLLPLLHRLRRRAPSRAR